MRRVHLFLGIGGLVVIAGTALAIQLVLQALQAPPGDTPTVLPTDDASSGLEEQVGSPASKCLAAPPPAGASEREPVAEDPCASARADLEAERAARVEAEEEVARLREELDRVTRERNALRFPEDTPWGAFLASPEAEEIRENIRSGSHLYETLLDSARYSVRHDQRRVAEDPSRHNTDSLERSSAHLQRMSEDREAAVDHMFGDIKAFLDKFPVMLQPGEATWIVERGVPVNDEGLVVYFLGPSRVAREVPLDRLFDDFLWKEDCGETLQAALPPDKRAELDAKLDALMEEVADDPEAVAWFRERYPTFFD